MTNALKSGIRFLTVLAILATSIQIAPTASAIGTLYTVETGTGDVPCTASGWFSIYNNAVYRDSNQCRGTANIPLGVTSIAEGAFYEVPLSEITIPSTVTSIGEGAFARSTLTSINIPNTVLSIGPRLFQNTSYLTSVTLGNGITEIPDRVFEHSHALTSVNIPSSVLSIGYGSFWAATALTSITIPDSVISVGPHAFQDMLALQSIEIGNGVANIGELAFADLPELTHLVIGNNVSSIGRYSFTGPNQLTSVSLPNSLTYLGINSFSERENSSSANANLLSYRFCGSEVNESALAAAGLGSKTRIACPAVITAGSELNSLVVTFPAGVTVAEIQTSSSLPAIKIAFAATAPEAVTVIPTTNSASLSATPFMTSDSLKIVDIRIANHDGSDVTVCLEGASTDLLYHYTAGEWVELRERSYTNGQVCGITNSFSLFAAAPAKPISAVSLTTDKAAAEAEAKRVAEQVATRTEIVKSFQSSQNVDAQTFAKAGISGITNSNISEVNAEILALPQESQGDLGQILKIARKYEVVGNIASENVVRVFPKTFVEVGLIPVDSPNKCLLSMAVRRLAPSDRDSFAEIKAAIDAEMALINARAIRLAALLAR
jgi:hypothetical protein